MAKEIMCAKIESIKDEILGVERHIWENPEPGYREWKTHKYLKEKYEALGLELHEAGDIPGFYTDIDTGREGPKIAIFGELDSLIIPTHPECDKETGAVHACGHNCQSAALYGVAAALTAPGALDGLSGSIRLVAVPAEESIELDFRKGLKDKGIIKYYSGKVEFLHRGYLDGVDMCFMVHVTANDAVKGIECNAGSNGCMVKSAEFLGKSAHAGGSPHRGINALYAASTALTAANALRETFRDDDHIRFHPIITEGGTAVNAIPEKVKVESFVRGANVDAILQANKKINRAFSASAAAIGCKVKLNDILGYAPLNNDKNLVSALKQVGTELFTEDGVLVTDGWSSGSTDMGDMSAVMPAIHPHIKGAVGNGHGSNFYITDPEFAVVKGAAFQACMVEYLLKDNAAYAKKIIAEKKTLFKTKEDYFAMVEENNKSFDGVVYNPDGSATIYG